MLKTEDKIIKDLIKSRLKNQEDLALFKRKVAKKYDISMPSNIELLTAYHKLLQNESVEKSQRLEDLLKTRPIRSLSGIVNVSVLTKPYPCPGKCLYCPKESGLPKSYVSGEPAVERAKKLNFAPYLQVEKRLEMLKTEGHPTDKIELRIVGGTWSYYPKKYQDWFIKECFRAANEMDDSKKSKIQIPNPKQIPNYKLQILEKEQKRNEKAKHRIVGLSIETRPDFINLSEIKRLRKLGATMVELGVQSIYDGVLKLNQRGHTVKETVLATKLLKDAGFKVLYQMMPNLMGSDLKKDEKMFEEIFQNPDFQPDLLKIYPCCLLKEAALYQYWKKGKYKPYSEKQLINLIRNIKKKIPYYVRIQRIARDIPSSRIVTGPARISNLRQILSENAKKQGWRCHCIRCREIKEKYFPREKIFLLRQDYNASGAKEIFLSFENPGSRTSVRYGADKNRKLYSLLRIRITSTGQAIIREIHTYGQQVPISEFKLAPQHQGLGKKLIKEAEKIAKKEFALNRVAVISGVGVRNYFRKLGYKLKDTYMVKNLSR